MPRHGVVLVGPDRLRQVFNDTDAEVLWLIIGGPEDLEFLQGSKSTGMDLSLIYPVDPKQLPKELAGVEWPPREGASTAGRGILPIDFEERSQEWLAAWNARDLERILAHYADDVEFSSPFIAKLSGDADGVLRGKPALRDYFGRGLAAYPALKFGFIRLYPGVRSCVLEYRSVDDLRAAEVMEFDAVGKICRVRAHYSRG